MLLPVTLPEGGPLVSSVPYSDTGAASASDTPAIGVESMEEISDSVLREHIKATIEVGDVSELRKAGVQDDAFSQGISQVALCSVASVPSLRATVVCPARGLVLEFMEVAYFELGVSVSLLSVWARSVSRRKRA